MAQDITEAQEGIDQSGVYPWSMGDLNQPYVPPQDRIAQTPEDAARLAQQMGFFPGGVPISNGPRLGDQGGGMIPQQVNPPMEPLPVGKIRFTPTGNVAMDNAMQRIQNQQPGWGAIGPQLAMQMAAGLPVGNGLPNPGAVSQDPQAAMQMAQMMPQGQRLPNGNLPASMIHHSPYFQQKALADAMVQHQLAEMPFRLQNIQAEIQNHRDARLNQMVQRVGGAFAPMLVQDKQGSSPAKLSEIIKYHIDPQAELLAQTTGWPVSVVRSALIKELQTKAWEMQQQATKTQMERDKMEMPVLVGDRWVGRPSEQNPNGYSVPIPNVDPKLTGEAADIDSIRKIFYKELPEQEGMAKAQEHYFKNKQRGAEAGRGFQGDAAEIDSIMRLHNVDLNTAQKIWTDYKSAASKAGRPLAGDAADIESYRQWTSLPDSAEGRAEAERKYLELLNAKKNATTVLQTPSGVRELIARNGALQKQLEHIEEQYKSGGGAFIGPVRGRWSQFVNAAPDGTWGQSEKSALFDTSLQQFSNEVLKMMSGTAVTASEFARVAGALPKLTDSDVRFKANLAISKQNIKSLMDELQKNGNASGFKAFIPPETKKNIEQFNSMGQ